MEWHAEKTEDAIKGLNSSESGLSIEEAESRLSRFGLNELSIKQEISPLYIFLRQFSDPLIIILLVATLLSAVVGDLFDSLLIFAIVIFSAVLGFFQEFKAEKAVDELKKMLSPVSTVIREGSRKQIPSTEIVAGDIIVLESGDRVPADARLIDISSLKVDESSLTGESVPVEKSTEELPPETELAERFNMVYSGTEISYGKAKAVVVNTGMETELGKIAGEVGTVEDQTTPLERRTNEIGKWFGLIAIGVCVIVAASGILRQSISDGFDLSFTLSIIMFSVALAVAAVPEALAAIVTGTLAIGMREMAKSNAIIKRMPAVETLGSVTVICSDKTGTITKGEMTIRKIFANGEYIEISGTGYDPDGKFDPEGSREELLDLIRAGLLCNDSSLVKKDGDWDIKGDPTEGAFLVLATKAGFRIEEYNKKNKRLKDLPFSSERKRMTTVNETEHDNTMSFMKGAPEIILERCSLEKMPSGAQTMTDVRKKELKKIAESMADEGLRVLGIAMKNIEGDEYRENDIENDMTFLGFAGMIDKAREEAIEAVNTCREIGITPVMITGDHKLTARAVARDAGIFKDGDRILTGSELDDISDEHFKNIVANVSVYARVSPMHKLRIIEAWKDIGEIVAMTGDGVNDAPALKRADIGIAMGITGTEVSKEASDMVLADDNFATIVRAIERGRWIYDNIKKYLAYLLRANIVEVFILGGVAMAMGIEFLPLLPAAILYINLITDGLPAIALGISPPDPDIMKRSPRDPDESIFSTDVRLFILLGILIEVPVFFWVFSQSSSLTDARTSLFFMFVLIELVIALNFRSLTHSIIKVRPHNWLIVSVAVSIGITFALVRLGSVRKAFGIDMPVPGNLSIIIALAVGVTFVFEITKSCLRYFKINHKHFNTE